MKDWLKTSNLLLTIAIVISITACANIGTLSGGPIDETAPGIDIDNPPIPASNSTEFRKSKIKITFDEWVKLNSPAKNIIISPQINPTPTYKLVGKSLEIDLSECVLDRNTTYNISYGEAIQDITEGNTSKNLEYIFSTGAVIDTLQVSGKIADYITGDPLEENVLISLYKENGDAKYITKANTNGSFKINNINDSDYKAIAFIDKNGNNKLDSTEDRSFSSNISGLDSTVNDFKIFPKYTNTVTSYKTNGDYYLYELENDLKFNEVEFNENDSYYNNYIVTTNSEFKFSDQVLHINKSPIDIDSINDALLIRINNDQFDYDSKNPVAVSDSIIYLYFNQEIINIDTSKIKVSNDILEIDINKYIIEENYISFNIKEETVINLSIMDSAIIGHIGYIKPIYFKLNKGENINGSLEIDLVDEQSNKIYFLINSEGNSEYIPSRKGDKLFFSNIPSGKYKLKIIEDSNQNNSWDTGDIDKNIHPEKIEYSREYNIKRAWTSKETY